MTVIVWIMWWKKIMSLLYLKKITDQTQYHPTPVWKILSKLWKQNWCKKFLWHFYFILIVFQVENLKQAMEKNDVKVLVTFILILIVFQVENLKQAMEKNDVKVLVTFILILIVFQVENLEQAVAEIERLRKEGEKLQGELAGQYPSLSSSLSSSISFSSSISLSLSLTSSALNSLFKTTIVLSQQIYISRIHFELHLTVDLPTLT